MSPGKGVRRIRRRSPIQTKKGTEAYERELIEAALSTSTPSREERRLADFAVEFLTSYCAANNKYATLEAKESILRVHLIPEMGTLLLSEINARVIEAYKAKKLTEELSPKTINNHLTTLRKLLSVAQEWELIEHVPPVKWLKVPPQKFDFLSFEEAERLVNAADAQWRPAILVGLRCGLRIGEIMGLRWEDVDLVAGRLVVNRAVSRGRIGSPKNGRTREMPLGIDVLRALKDHRHLKGESVFCGPAGRLLHKNETKHPLWRACRKAGLRQIGWHALRHSFGIRGTDPVLHERVNCPHPRGDEAKHRSSLGGAYRGMGSKRILDSPKSRWSINPARSAPTPNRATCHIEHLSARSFAAL